MTPPEDPSAIERVPASGGAGPVVGVILEPDRAHLNRELLGAAASIAHELSGWVAALTLEQPRPAVLGSLGADEVVAIEGELCEEDIARVVGEWATDASAWAVLAPSTAWGREVAARAAARGSGQGSRVTRSISR